MNKTFLAGNLGKDPELRYTTSGTAIAKFQIATTDVFKGEKKTHWHTIIAWGKLAEVVAKYLVKGSLVFVCGKIGYNKWEKDGRTLYSTEITAEEIKFGSRAAVEDQPAAEFPF